MTAMISSSTNSTRSTTVSALNLPTDTNEEDQLTRINLQALQNRDPYISKIVDQAQRVCVYKFNAEKREWVNATRHANASNSPVAAFRNEKISKEPSSSTNGR